MNTYTIFIIGIFICINILILWSDIFDRKIKNSLLFLLLGILPFWYFFFPLWSTENIIIQSIFSIILIGWWILFYQWDGLLGSGDIKYAAILILFLGQHPISILIGNIGILTILILGFWWSMILGQIFAMREYIGNSDKLFLSRKISRSKIISWFLFFILDWGIIGCILSLLTKDLSLKIFEIIPGWWDFYFLISLYIFILRPGLRYMITKWEYRIFPIIMGLLYIWYYIQKNGMETLSWEALIFFSSIWKNAIILSLISIITRETFWLYDRILRKTATKSLIQTIPYGVIIFIWYMLLFFHNINLVMIMKNL